MMIILTEGFEVENKPIRLYLCYLQAEPARIRSTSCFEPNVATYLHSQVLDSQL